MLSDEVILDDSVLGKFRPTDSWTISAERLGISPLEFFRNSFVEPQTLSVIDIKGRKGEADTRADVEMVPGHQWAGDYGPRRSRVMIIGKRLGDDEVIDRRNFVGKSGEMMRDMFDEFHLDSAGFFCTNICRFLPPDGGRGNLKAIWIKDCAAALAQEIALVQPEYILLLGADSVKWLFGKKATLSSVRGAVLTLKDAMHIGTFPEVMEDEFNDLFRGIKVVATSNPAHVLREPSEVPKFKADIEMFAELLHGDRSVDSINRRLPQNYFYIDDEEGMLALRDTLILGNHKDLAIDCEWDGADYKTGKLLTIQIAWAAGYSACIILRRQHAKLAFTAVGANGRREFNLPRALEIIREIVDRDGVEISGQSLRADAKWLEDAGIPVMKRFTFDTFLADHCLDESADHRLEPQAVRYTDMGRYDMKLRAWLKSNPIAKNAGYGSVPDRILHPYANADADATWRIKQRHKKKLDHEAEIHTERTAFAKKLGRKPPQEMNLKRLFYEIIMPANLPIHELEMTGFMADTDRMLDLLWKYDARKNVILAELRDMIGNSAFNPRSFLQKVDLLFEPADKGGLELVPIKTTEKPPREWWEVTRLKPVERARLNPSTDTESLDLLAIQAGMGTRAEAIINKLKDFMSIDQITKNFLRPPEGVEEDDYFPTTVEEYTRGLLGCVHIDGAIRTSISQAAETGRWRSFGPNMQNLPKRKEPVFKRIMGYDIASIRSCFVARPGCVLIPCDFVSAEVVTLAYVSNDTQLIIDATGPVKVHAKVAVDILQAPCEYHEVAKKFPNLYVGAKNIVFGIPYQRGPKALARQINQETEGRANMTPEAMRDHVDAYYERYTGVAQYIADRKNAVLNPGYIDTPYGRRRRFYIHGASESVIAAQQREGVNFEIQSIVADTLNIAMFNLWSFRQHYNVDYRILLGVHDEAILEVPIPQIARVVDEVLPVCMVHGCRIPEYNFHLGIDPEICLRWGETPDIEDLKALGVPERFWPEQEAA